MLGQAMDLAARHLLTVGPLLVAFTWAMTLLGAAVAYVFQSDERGPEARPRSLRGFLRFCFPAAILRHPSCRLDVLYSVTVRLLHPLAIAPLLIGNVAVATTVHGALVRSFGARAIEPGAAWTWVAVLVLVIVLQDLITFLVHVVMHRSAA